MIISPGSSPLTRGKRARYRRAEGARRLIPAHAGKTTSSSASPTTRRAHPRSRGENSGCLVGAIVAMGSSPLTRGKLRVLGVPVDPARLIPAHAGKTGAPARSAMLHAAHPRSRGENDLVAGLEGCAQGSSPLTRGKLVERERERCLPRLIPAHAGKTRGRSLDHLNLRAHPRSRGENVGSSPPVVSRSGSSPLTRGKPGMTYAGELYERLIPAHAGKTQIAHLRGLRVAAHPRSRGENGVAGRP